MSRSNGRRKEKEKGLISLQVAPRRLYRPAGSERCLLIGGVDYLHTYPTATRLPASIPCWDRDGNTIMDHVAGVENLMVAMAAYERLAVIGRTKP